MMQVARNVTDLGDGILRDKRYLILDRDAKYTEGFCGALSREGVEVIRLPVRAPNLNAYAERFVRTIKEECLNRMVFFGVRSLRHAIGEFVAH
jgi:putative transposase